MQLTADQELRRELLLFSLSKHADLEAALKSAAEMERFVLRGCAADPGAGRRPGVVNGSDTGFCAEPVFEDEHESSSEPNGRQMNGHDFAKPGQNGTTHRAPPGDGWRDEATVSRKRRWSEADDQSLRRLWHSNHSLEEIAEAMGRTTPSLYSRARALGMSKRSPAAGGVSERLPAINGREAPGAAKTTAAADEKSEPPEESFRRPAPLPPKSPPGIGLKRHRPEGAGGTNGDGGEPRRNGRAADAGSGDATLESGVEPIIHFLRSRDYSVVRVEDGRFRVDGRRVLSAEELREKANQVRQSMGKPPFAPQSAGPAG